MNKMFGHVLSTAALFLIITSAILAYKSDDISGMLGWITAMIWLLMFKLVENNSLDRF